VYGEIIGSLVVSTWLPGHDFAIYAGFVTVGLADVIAVAAVVLVWSVNILGIRPTVNLSYLTAAMLMVPIVVFILGPVISGDWSSAKLSWRLGDPGQSWGGWQLAIVWLYIMLWTSLGVETCATFAPEYRNPVQDTARALRAAGSSRSPCSCCCRSGSPARPASRPPRTIPSASMPTPSTGSWAARPA
jgi:amino acid transporter